MNMGATPHDAARKPLEKLQDGFAVAQELAEFFHRLGTRIPDEADLRREQWEQGEQGKRFQAALGVLPNDETIHHDIGYALRVLMCDVALAHLHRDQSSIRSIAEQYRSGKLSSKDNLSIQVGIDAWELIWDSAKDTFTHMVLQEPVTQPAGLEYTLSLRISIPEELRV